MHHCAHVAILHMSWLIHAQLLFTWKPSLLGFPSSYLNICYYHQDLQHLQFHIGLHRTFHNKHKCPPTHYAHIVTAMGWYRKPVLAPSIFGASQFGR